VRVFSKISEGVEEMMHPQQMHGKLFMHLFEGDENVCPQLILTSF
jgi:hypothetical protein